MQVRAPGMTSDQIHAHRVFYQERIKSFTAKLRELQDYCPHEGHNRVARSDTGNWCRADDRFWYDCICADCGKVWTEDQ